MPAVAREPAQLEEEPPAANAPAVNAGGGEPLKAEETARGLPNIPENTVNVVRAWIRFAVLPTACCGILVFVPGLGIGLGMWASSLDCGITMAPLQATAGGGVRGAHITRCVLKPVVAAHTTLGSFVLHARDI